LQQQVRYVCILTLCGNIFNNFIIAATQALADAGWPLAGRQPHPRPSSQRLPPPQLQLHSLHADAQQLAGSKGSAAAAASGWQLPQLPPRPAAFGVLPPLLSGFTRHSDPSGTCQPPQILHGMHNGDLLSSLSAPGMMSREADGGGWGVSGGTRKGCDAAWTARGHRASDVFPGPQHEKLAAPLPQGQPGASGAPTVPLPSWQGENGNLPAAAAAAAQQVQPREGILISGRLPAAGDLAKAYVMDWWALQEATGMKRRVTVFRRGYTEQRPGGCCPATSTAAFPGIHAAPVLPPSPTCRM